MSNYKLIHLVRKVGPTSMPWNDLYKTHHNLNKRSAGYVFEISKSGYYGLQKETETNLKYFRLLFTRAFFILLKYVLLLKRKNYTPIIHVHNMSLIPYALLLKIFGIKCILNVHNSLINFNFYQLKLLKLGIKYFDAIIPVSECVGREVSLMFPLLEKKIVPIRNGINLKTLDLLSSLDGNEKEIDVIIVARHVKQKNVMRIISVLSLCQNIHKVVWFGEGPEFSAVDACIKNKNLSKIIELKGLHKREKVLTAVNKSKVFLSLSKWEGLGVANIEALALPVEVVLSNIAPHYELKENTNLTIVKLENSDEEIASVVDHKILQIHNNKKFLKMRALKIRAEYDLRKIIKKYIFVYQAVAASK